MKSTQDLISFAREALGLPNSSTIKLLPLAGRGSDRTFFRLAWNQTDSAILAHYDPKRVENMYYADIAIFLRDIDVAAPLIIRHDPTRRLIVMEDLGDTDLWALRKTPWETRRTLYQKTLAILHRLHSFPEKDFPKDRVRVMESFGPDLYRWEREYFREHFVNGVCGIELEPSNACELEAELSSLAEQLQGTVHCLVHRDLQSQNVMIRGAIPFLIDFQGMRFGCPFYDLGSLLNDPYVDFSEDERNELLTFYYRLSTWNLNWATYQNYFWEASAQRLMQALGAYGFLGIKKGLKAYLEHVPRGLENLHRAVLQVESLPQLLKLSEKCRKVVEQKN